MESAWPIVNISAIRVSICVTYLKGSPILAKALSVYIPSVLADHTYTHTHCKLYNINNV